MNARNIASISALTPIQEGILFHAIADHARQVYHSQFSARIDGALDAARWRAAWDMVIARHDTLRTLFTWEGRDKPLQIVRERVDTPWQELDWRQSIADEHGAMLEALLDRDRDLGFELDRAPLLRLILIRLGDNHHRFVLTFHHLILDGWSMRLILEEAQQIYADSDALPASAPSFSRYVEWQAARDATSDDQWWGERLASFDAPVFPDVHDGIDAARVSHHVATRTLAPAQVETLTRVAREQRVTLSSVIAAAWALLLGRYADVDDVVFGTTVSGRPPELPDVEQIAGMFINTLPLRIALDPAHTVAQFLHSVQRAQVEQRSMEASALGSAQRASGVTPGEPLFESILVYENFPAAPAAQTRELALHIDHFVEYSHFPLAILAVPDEPFALIGVSDPARMGEAALNDLLDNLQTTVMALVEQLETPLAQINTLSVAQRQTVTHEFNDTARPVSEVSTLWHQTAAHAAATPDAVALIDSAGPTSYAKLMSTANAVAAALLSRAVAPGDPVLIIGPRSADTVTAIMGVHGAGAAYVPVAADAPPQRVAQIASELAALNRPVRALITGDTNVQLPESVTRMTLRDIEPAPDSNVAGPALDSSAYYMFTSGSTGTPKGVDVSQRNLFHSVHARDEYYAAPPSMFALLSTLATDSSVAGLFWTLGRGGTLVLPADRAEQDMAALMAFLEAKHVTHLLTVPSLYSVMLEQTAEAPLPHLAVAIVAGEACPDTLVAQHARAAPERQLHNEYGPTETTVWCSAARLHANVAVDIGRPLANTQTHVLNRRQQPLPIGVAGELYVGGPQVAQGYVGDAEKTAAQFIASPFADGERLYRTGDRVRWSRAGRLSFVGRTDDQIKVRGFRVEPGEIEACILDHSTVQETAVVLNDAGAAAQLVAFVCGPQALNTDALRESLQTHLPNYMVPQRIEALQAMPRTAAGKIDRRGLARQSLSKTLPERDSSAKPTNDDEHALAAIWCDVLGLDDVGIHDDFFALGGDSLLSIRVLARAGKAGLRIAPADFFAWPTISGQAAHADHSGARKISQKPLIGAQPLMPIQRWFFDHIQPGREHWNLSYRFDVRQRVVLADVQRAVAAVVTTHDALRSGFEQQRDGAWHCRLHAPREFDVVSELDLTQADTASVDAEVRETADQLNADFDLAQPPLLRVCLVHTPDTMQQQLVIVVHHLIVDAESWRILIEDLELALEQLTQKQTLALPAKTNSLAAFSKHLISWSEQDDFVAIERDWQSRLRQPPVDLTPEDNAGESFTEGHVRQQIKTLDAHDTAALLASATDARATTLELLLAGVASALGQHLGDTRVRFELEGHGREALFETLDISRTVGWMTTAFPLTVQCDQGWQDASAALRQAKSALRDLPHRGLSYGAIMASTSETPAATDVRRTPRCAVLFNFLGQRESADASHLLQLVDERCGQARATDAPRAYLLEMNATIENDQLVIHMVCPQAAFASSTIDTLGETLLSTLRTLAGGQSNTVVPEDFPLANLDQQGLSDLSDLLDELDD